MFLKILSLSKYFVEYFLSCSDLQFFAGLFITPFEQLIGGFCVLHAFFPVDGSVFQKAEMTFRIEYISVLIP